MSEIDHPGQIEDERQAERHERIESADNQAIEDIEENELCHTQDNIKIFRLPRHNTAVGANEVGI